MSAACGERRFRTVRGVGAAMVAFALAVPLAAHVAPPSVRFVEIGNRGVARSGGPIGARVDVATDAPFHGTLTALWGSESRTTWGSRTTLRLALEAGERRETTLLLLPGPTRLRAQPELVRWSLADASDRVLQGGEEVVRVEPPLAGDLDELYLTDLSLERSHRPPAEAFDNLLAYAGFDACLISGSDLRRLRPAQRQALLDHAALGGVLVVTAPVVSLGEFLDTALARREALGWADERRREAREASLHMGLVRTADVPLDELAASGEGGLSPLARLLLSPRPLARAQPGLLELERWVFRRAPLSLSGTQPADAAWAASLLGTLAVLLVSAAVWVASRPQSGAFGRLSLLVAAACVVLPLVTYLALAPVRAGNYDSRREIVLHDGHGPFQSRGTYLWRGGGGGAQNPAFDFATGPRARWEGTREDTGDTLELRQDLTGSVRLARRPRDLTVNRRLSVHRVEVQADEPAWDEQDVELREGRLVGRLFARRDFGRVEVIGRHGVFRKLGPVRSGDTLDLVDLGLSLAGPAASGPQSPHAWESAGSVPLLGEWAALGVEMAAKMAGARSGAPAFYLVAEEASPSVSPVAVLDEPSSESRVVHVQPLHAVVSGKPAGPDAGPLGDLPAEADGALLRVHVPEVMWAEMQPRGLRLIVSLPGIDQTPVAIASAPTGGFREVVFRPTAGGGIAPGFATNGHVPCRAVPRGAQR